MGEHLDMLAACPECGAPPVDGLSCWEQLGMLIAWEANDPDLRAEHFLLVVSYNLQHPAQFTAEALVNMRDGIIQYLDSGVAVEVLRRRAALQFEGSRRVLKPAAERLPVPRMWGMTIADVYVPDHPEGAAGRVKAWGATVRRELL